MNKFFKLSVFFVLVMLFGAKAFGQEWEYSIPYQPSDSEMTRQYCAYELSDGRVIVSASFLYNIGSYAVGYPFYPPHNALVALSPEGVELARNNYVKPGYWGSSYNPYVFENENGELFMLTTFSPDHESRYFNYFLNYDNPPTDAILGLYKLDDNLEIIESHEYSFPVDTTLGQSTFDPCESSGSIHLHSAILDGNCMVGVYTKNVSKDNDSIHGYDSIFFFRMNFDGELLANAGYEIPYSGLAWQMVFWREQLVPTDYGYIYYNNRSNVPPAPAQIDKNRIVGGSVVYMDKNFNLLRIRHFKHPNTTNNPWPFDDVSIMRSKHNTTYFATRSNRHYEQTEDDCYLYEFDDDIEGTQEVVPVLHDIHRGVPDFDFVAECRAVDVAVDGSVYFCYSLNVGFSLANDSWVVIEKFDENMNTISEVYYGTDDDLIWYCAESITTTRDGGVLMTAHTKELTNQNKQGSVVVKFPAEAFVGIDEAHENGLKVAIAYPNPGKDVLNIRTGLRDAWVKVYDVNGRLVHRQAITENVTGIDAEGWADGVYVWKVMTNGKEAEIGKWVKE
jgi:hypothetical protein